MPITFSIDPSKKIIFTMVTGPLLDSDPVRYLSAVLKHPAYRPGFSALVACKNVEIGSFSTSSIRRLGMFTRDAEQELRDSRVALVAHQPVVYGLARMYQLVRDPPYEFQVFRELSAAEAWLGVDSMQTDEG